MKSNKSESKKAPLLKHIQKPDRKTLKKKSSSGSMRESSTSSNSSLSSLRRTSKTSSLPLPLPPETSSSSSSSSTTTTTNCLISIESSVQATSVKLDGVHQSLKNLNPKLDAMLHHLMNNSIESNIIDINIDDDDDDDDFDMEHKEEEEDWDAFNPEEFEKRTMKKRISMNRDVFEDFLSSERDIKQENRSLNNISSSSSSPSLVYQYSTSDLKKGKSFLKKDKHIELDDEDDEDEDQFIPLVKNPSDFLRINPRNRFRLFWDVGLLMPLLVYLGIAMPFRLCFGNEANLYTPFYYFEFGIDMVFLCDICFNFFTGYFVGREDLDNHLVEFDLACIAYRYATSWFLIDVVSGIPFSLIDLLLDQDSSSLSFLKTFKLLRFLRFLKLGRLLKFEKIFSSMDRDTLDDFQDFLQYGSTRTVIIMVKLALIFGVVCHVMACGFVFMGRSSALLDQPSWFDENFHDATSAKDSTGKTGFENVSTIYIAAYYFAITTMTSVGFGDIIPASNSERIFTCILEFVGAIVCAIIIASLTSVVSASDTNARIAQEQLDAVASYVEVRQFPDKLGKLIRRHFRHFYSLKAAVDETRIFSELSPILRKQVSTYLISEMLGTDSFFFTTPSHIWPSLLNLFSPMKFEPKEDICNFGEECYEMYVVIHGHARGVIPENTNCYHKEKKMRGIVTGSHINILGLLGLWPKAIETITTITVVETYAINHVEFIQLFASGNENVKNQFRRLQIKESFNYRMDLNEISEFAPLGKPLYYLCFSSIQIILSGIKYHQCHEISHVKTCWIVIQLLDQNLIPCSDLWRDETEHLSNISNEIELNEVIKWDDVTVPFASTSIRFRLFEKANDFEILVGELVVKLTDIDSDPKYQDFEMEEEEKERRLNHQKDEKKKKIIYNPIMKNFRNKLRNGELEGWFPMLDVVNNNSSKQNHNEYSQPVIGLKSTRSASFKNDQWNKVQTLHTREIRDQNHRPSSSPLPSIKDRLDPLTRGSSLHSVHLRLFADRPESTKSRSRARARSQARERSQARGVDSIDRWPSESGSETTSDAASERSDSQAPPVLRLSKGVC